MATDLLFMMRTEAGEVFQDDGSVGSSTMPQKRNPTQITTMLCVCQKMSSLLAESHRAMIFEDEASSASFPIIADNIEKAVQLNYWLLVAAMKVLKTLVINKEQMRANLDMNGGWIMAESLMMHLSDKLGKARAHHLLHDLAMESRKNGTSIRGACRNCPDLASISDEEINNALAPESYTGCCEELIEQTVSKIRTHYESA